MDSKLKLRRKVPDKNDMQSLEGREKERERERHADRQTDRQREREREEKEEEEEEGDALDACLHCLGTQ